MSEVQRDTARPRFFIEAVKNDAKSKKAGRPIFEDKEMVEIRIPGDKHNVPIRYVDEKELINGKWVDSRDRWPQEYEAFKRGEQRATTGTPIEQWPHPSLTAARVAELKALYIFSVEDLAGVSDSNLGKMGMGGRELRDAARTYLENAKGGAAAEMAAEIAALKEMVEQLKGATLRSGATEVTDEAEKKVVLKAIIKEKTGSLPKGNPSVETLQAQVANLS